MKSARGPLFVHTWYRVSMKTNMFTMKHYLYNLKLIRFYKKMTRSTSTKSCQTQSSLFN